MMVLLYTEVVLVVVALVPVEAAILIAGSSASSHNYSASTEGASDTSSRDGSRFQYIVVACCYLSCTVEQTYHIRRVVTPARSHNTTAL